MRNFSLFLCLILLFSCNYNRNSSANSFENRRDTLKDSLSENINPTKQLNNQLSFLENYEFKSTPLKDSTNFNNFKSNNLLLKEQVELLQLNKKTKEGVSFKINYRINLSDRFHTIVISYKLGDNELYTVLINYDENYKIIDSIEIAFDEIAESFLRKESKITKSEIKIKDCDSSSGETKFKISIYKIQPNGKLLKTRQI